MIEIFKTGLIEYPEKHLEKPVKYEEQHLKEIASLINSTDITDTHKGNVIGKLSNFTYKDGVLYADEPDVEYEGKGLSPSFEFGLIDKGDYYTPYDIKLLNVALTDKPKSHIFYNSIQDGDDDLDIKEKEELLNTISENQKRQRQQEQEIGILKNKNKELEEANKKNQETIKELKDKQIELDKLQKDYDSLKTKSEAYDNLINDKKTNLIKKIAPEADDETLEKLNKMSLDDLKFFNEKKILNTNPKGIGSDGSPGQGKGEEGGSKKPTPEEEYAKWDEENDKW